MQCPYIFNAENVFRLRTQRYIWLSSWSARYDTTRALFRHSLARTRKIYLVPHKTCRSAADTYVQSLHTSGRSRSTVVLDHLRGASFFANMEMLCRIYTWWITQIPPIEKHAQIMQIIQISHRKTCADHADRTDPTGANVCRSCRSHISHRGKRV